jgi:hypothetical protein
MSRSASNCSSARLHSSRKHCTSLQRLYAVEEKPLPYLVMEFIAGETHFGLSRAADDASMTQNVSIS